MLQGDPNTETKHMYVCTHICMQQALASPHHMNHQFKHGAEDTVRSCQTESSEAGQLPRGQASKAQRIALLGGEGGEATSSFLRTMGVEGGDHQSQHAPTQPP